MLAAIKNTLFALFLGLAACGSSNGQPQDTPRAETPVVVGANRTGSYFPLLRGKRLALVANQTSVIFRDGGGPVHLADSLLASGMQLKRVFAPEHGFRGQADAGEHVQDGTDVRTGLPIVSLYGANRKPGKEQLEGLDMVVFDIQDLGVRFYTYIATLQLVMEACAEAGIPVLVLDRPNPNADFVDGPIMEKEHMGFLGMTPIPLAYGMTIGEYAEMINGEGWLEGGVKADLTVIPLESYRRDIPYELPIPPSPNIPNTQAARLYPSLGLFEGTTANAGRGTDWQFQCFGAPYLDPGHFGFSYTPQPNAGASHPKHEGVRCHGKDLRQVEPPKAVDPRWLIEAFTFRDTGSEFFITSGFTRHAGTALLQQQIEGGMNAEAIRESWKPGLEAFRAVRARYLRYP
ncbi:DUF1343 domain-containing protein [Robiginitalea sp. SC105]|uniref:exo-beta-N-acetylmuramidase NamZ family protein n=1 Tax=Robiginitalea sp. SC105 TaxID=2762332 RepID=UPI00163AD93F|nr:DUF1343 domain-containing protein [Robiginitalea sp. SC105]